MFPFDNRNMEINPDRALYHLIQEKVFHRYLVQAGISALPSDFTDYESFIRRVLEDDKRQGAMAIKLEATYFMPLHFLDPPRDQAEAIYTNYSRGGAPLQPPRWRK
jgi:hypothetical protein